MIQIEFREEDIGQLHYERFHHPHPQVQQRAEALYLKALGYSHQDICRIVRIHHKTLCRYLRAYKKGVWKSLRS
jgi:hypothetical protein